MEERTYKIPHNFFDDNGNVIKTEDIEFTTNVTDTTVYITMAVLAHCHSKLPHNAHHGEGVLDPARFDGKRIVWEDPEFGYVGDNVQEFYKYKMDCSGSSVQIDLYRKGEEKPFIQRATPAWEHPFLQKDEDK